MSKKNNKNFLVQGSILAIAGILVRVIGLLYRVPLTKIVGDVGMGYYSYAFEIYNLLLLLSSQSLPIAVSKIVSENVASKRNKNVTRVFKGAIYYSLIVGVIFAGVAFVFADYIAKNIYRTPEIYPLIVILAPTILVVCILGAFRGFFQGLGDMVPTSISQIIEQIVNAIVSVTAAYELISIVKAVNTIKAMDHNSKNYISIVSTFGASGSTLGTLFGAIGALVVLFIILIRFNKNSKAEILNNENSSDKIQSYRTIGKVILFTITPVILSTAIYNISNIIDNPIFQRLSIGNSVERAARYGLYSSGYKVLTTMPIAIASALSAAMVPSVVRTYISGSKKDINNKIDSALKFSMIIAMPCGMGLVALGKEFCDILFSFTGKTMSTMMLMSVFTVVFFSLSTISNAILQGIDKLNVPIKNSAISLVAHLVFIVIMLKVLKLDIYAVVIGDFTFALMVCILNNLSIKKFTGYKQNYVGIYLKPLFASVIMAVVTKLSYIEMLNITHRVMISVIIAVLLAVIVYGTLLVTFILTKEEIMALPKGGLIIKIAKKAHLIK